MQSKKRIASLGPVLSLAALIVGAGCNGGGLFGGDKGQLKVVLSAEGASAAAMMAPGAAAEHDDGDHDDGRLSSLFTSAKVTLSSVLVRNLDGQLVDLDVDLPVTVDVVKLEAGRQVVLPNGALPAGSYDQVVLVITAVEGTTRDGTKITIEPPGGGWTAVVPICPLEVAAGASQTVAITLNVRNSFAQEGSHWGFQPRFKSQSGCAGTGG